MEPSMTEDKVKADNFNVGNCSVEDQECSKEYKMDSAFDKYLFSTPHISRKDDNIQDSATKTAQSCYSADSGFSDRTFNSTWSSSVKDTPNLTVPSSPELEYDSNRRLTLKAYELSPINRGTSSGVPGRRLKFGAFDLQPLPLQLPQSDKFIKEIEGSNADFIRYEDAGSHFVTEAESGPLKPSIFSDYQSQCSPSLPHSIVADDLEASLQEMAIEESSPSVRSVTSPVNLISTNCDSDVQNDHVTEEENILSPLWASSKEVETISKIEQCCKHESGCSINQFIDMPYSLQSSQTITRIFNSVYSPKKHESPSTLDSETHHEDEPKLEFLNELSLTPVSSKGSHKLARVTISQHNSFRKPSSEYTNTVCDIFQDSKTTHASIHDSPPTLSNFKVSHLPNSSTLPTRIVNQFCKCDFVTKNNVVTHKHLIHKTTTKNLINSPSKRFSDYDEGSCSVFSPTKVRKIESVFSTLSTADVIAVISSPTKRAALRKESSHSDNDVMKLVCKQSQLHLSGPHLPARTSAEVNGVIRPSCEQTDNILNKELTNNADFRLCLLSKNSCCQAETSHIVDSVVGNLRRFIEAFSPPEPTRLIGRNVGLQKFDIVEELFSQNFQLCLWKIFQYLANVDLLSVARVSTIWKSALCSDDMTYNRYKQHKRSLSRSNQHGSGGKENCGEKPLCAPSEQPLTQSKGLLSSVQSQANRRVVLDAPATTEVKDTLLSDDILRICPRCQETAIIKPRQDRATCMNNKCCYDFCTLCFSSFHHPRQCKPLCKATSRGDVAGTRKSKKNLKRL